MAKQLIPANNSIVVNSDGSTDFSYHGVKKLYKNILTVSTNGGADYTTISAAITAASALSPSASNTIRIMV